MCWLRAGDSKRESGIYQVARLGFGVLGETSMMISMCWSLWRVVRTRRCDALISHSQSHYIFIASTCVLGSFFQATGLLVLWPMATSSSMKTLWTLASFRRLYHPYISNSCQDTRGLLVCHMFFPHFKGFCQARLVWGGCEKPACCNAPFQETKKQELDLEECCSFHVSLGKEA